MQKNSNKLKVSQRPATSEGNNLRLSRLSSGSSFRNLECFGSSEDIHQFMDQTVTVGGESATAATTKADMEMLAKNRDNAMLRYKEKKKTRRYYLFISLFHLFLSFVLCYLQQH